MMEDNDKKYKVRIYQDDIYEILERKIFVDEMDEHFDYVLSKMKEI